MQKIRTLIFAAAGCLVGTSAWTAETISLDPADVGKCFSETDRLDRLGCYDRLLGRPGIDDIGRPVATGGTGLTGETPPAVTFVEGFLATSATTAQGVHVTLLDRSTGEPVKVGDGVASLIDEPGGEQGDERLGRNADVYLALRNIDDARTDGALLVSCENNITRMRIKWGTPFETATVPARFLFGDTLTDEGSIKRVLRVGGQGYLLESARGLESIRLLRKMIAGSRVQISAGRGQAVRSLFFNANALRDALPMVGRHCSWKVGSA
ncbi:type VI secretion protein [Aestuariispira ectoiniformans]|uniref:type VI secretion protein n=1 Tax=Aestuariispira ectoiniformans TaxID=2775080 RepID=UPI00223BBEB8|nr:type VI secretion protein [Aestuariispira ectoiniformans]